MYTTKQAHPWGSYITQHERILVHVGTNDVTDLLRSRRTRSVTPQQALRKYKVLREVNCRQNSQALILFSSILPRLNQFRNFKTYKLLGLNFALEKWCATQEVPTCVYPILQELPGRRRAKRRIVCQGWHLNGAGEDRLEACFQQALSTEHQMVRMTAARMLRKLSELT